MNVCLNELVLSCQPRAVVPKLFGARTTYNILVVREAQIIDLNRDTRTT